MLTVRRRRNCWNVNDNESFKNFWLVNFQNQWENSTFKVFDAFLSSDHSYIDVGAWIGPTVLYGATKAKHCYAVEPDPVAFAELEKNLSFNPEVKVKTTLFDGCISNETGEIHLGTLSKFGDSLSSILKTDSSNLIKKEALTLEDFITINKINDCNFIKMDIEGAEYLVLPQAIKVIKRVKPTMLISMHPPAFPDDPKIAATLYCVLNEYKYVINALSGKELTCDVFCKLVESKQNHVLLLTDQISLLNRLSFRVYQKVHYEMQKAKKKYRKIKQ